jgi:hypothetical protein
MNYRKRSEWIAHHDWIISKGKGRFQSKLLQGTQKDQAVRATKFRKSEKKNQFIGKSVKYMTT